MNKFLKGFCVVCIMTAIICMASYANDSESYTEDIFTYTVSDNQAVITNIEDVREVVIIPEKLGGYTVISISSGACGGSNKIREIIISDTVTSVGSMCFAYSPGISAVKLPSALKSIGDGAFYQCENLWCINIPDGTSYVGDNAFAMCSNLTAATVPDSVTQIGPSAFPVSDGFRIYASVTSDAHYYAETNGIGFEELIHVKVNGKEIVFDQPCITDTQNYKTLVPMRAVLESLDAQIEWDDMMNMARIDVMDSRLLIRPEEPFMMINNQVYYLSRPAVEFNNRIMLPIRDVIEALSGKIAWDEDQKLITVTCNNK